MSGLLLGSDISDGTPMKEGGTRSVADSMIHLLGPRILLGLVNLVRAVVSLMHKKLQLQFSKPTVQFILSKEYQ